jgi:hypothetical protein
MTFCLGGFFLINRNIKDSKIMIKLKHLLLIAAFLENHKLRFLFNTLELIGDPKADIMKCLDYALDQNMHAGSTVVMAKENKIETSVLT